MIKIIVSRNDLLELTSVQHFKRGRRSILTIDDIVKHIKHIVKVGGIDVVGLV